MEMVNCPGNSKFSFLFPTRETDKAPADPYTLALSEPDTDYEVWKKDQIGLFLEMPGKLKKEAYSMRKSILNIQKKDRLDLVLVFQP